MITQFPGDLTLARKNGNVQIKFLITKNIPQGVNIVKILLERYTVPLVDENLADLKGVVENQSVLQHTGEPTAYSSKVFWSGGSYLGSKAELIDITSAIENKYPYLIDVDSDLSGNLYLYRIIAYGSAGWEYATRYVAGYIDYSPLINIPESDSPENEFLRWLDVTDIEAVAPDNVAGIVEWLTCRSLFHETYKLRYRGEIEDFKFATYESRAWLLMHLMYYIHQRNGDMMAINERLCMQMGRDLGNG
jgi:hypothetical protein